MSIITRLPSPRQVVDLLTTLLDLEIKVSEAQSVSRGDVAATYVDGKGEIRAACVMDANAAVAIGAAFTRIPPAAAKEQASERRFDGGLADNITEFLNVASQLFRDPHSDRVALDAVYLPGKGIPSDVEALLMQPKKRLDLEIDVATYVTGRMSLLVMT
jgi:hypothetical protein